MHKVWFVNKHTLKIKLKFTCEYMSNLWSHKSTSFILQIVRWWIDLRWMCWAQRYNLRQEDSIYGTLTSDVLLSRRDAPRNPRLQMCSPELTTQTRTGKSVIDLKLNTSMQMSIRLCVSYVFISRVVVHGLYVMGSARVHDAHLHNLTITLQAARLFIDKVAELCGNDLIDIGAVYHTDNVHANASECIYINRWANTSNRPINLPVKVILTLRLGDLVILALLWQLLCPLVHLDG